MSAPSAKRPRKSAAAKKEGSTTARPSAAEPSSVSELLGSLFGGPAAGSSEAGAVNAKPAKEEQADGAEEPGLSSTYTRLFGSAQTPSSQAASSSTAVAKKRRRGQDASASGNLAAAATEESKEDEEPEKEVAPEKEPEQNLSKEARKQKTEDEKKQQNARTLYLGNVPLDWDEKKVKSVIRQEVGDTYKGKLAPIWFRNLPLKDCYHAKQFKRLGAMWKDWEESAADCKDAYVMVKSAADLKTVMNAVHNYQADSQHRLRADGVGDLSRFKTFDKKRSVLVGNLHKDTREIDLRRVFEKVGEIQAVKLVVDKETKLCRGTAFVLFKERGSLKAALWCWGALCKGREMRVSRLEGQQQEGGEKKGEETHPAQWRIDLKMDRWRKKEMTKVLKRKRMAKIEGMPKKSKKAKKEAKEKKSNRGKR